MCPTDGIPSDLQHVYASVQLIRDLVQTRRRHTDRGGEHCPVDEIVPDEYHCLAVMAVYAHRKKTKRPEKQLFNAFGVPCVAENFVLAAPFVISKVALPQFGDKFHSDVGMILLACSTPVGERVPGRCPWRIFTRFSSVSP